MNSHGESSWEGQKAICVCSGLVGYEGAPTPLETVESQCAVGANLWKALEHSQILFGSPPAPSMEMVVIFFFFSHPQPYFFKTELSWSHDKK